MSEPSSPEAGTLHPLLPLRRGVILPGRVTTLPIGRARSRELARTLSAGDELVLATQHDPKVEDPALADVHSVGVLAVVRDKVDRGQRGFMLVVEGRERVSVEALTSQSPFWHVRVAPLGDLDAEAPETEALAESLRAHLQGLAPKDASLHGALAKATPSAVADLAAAWIDTPTERKLEVLHERSVPARLRLVANLVKEARARAELRQKVDSEVRSELSKNQKEAMLRHQLRAIQKELGELNGEEGDELEQLREKLQGLELGEEARKTVDRELKRLTSLGNQSPEANVIRTFLETVAELPWAERSEARLDLDEVAEALDADHHGLEDVKRRVLEHMAVLRLAPEARGTTLCLVGPPGVGKTSLAQSVADATGRPLVRVSLGGIRDEAEIRGHRRTYVGAMPGRLVAALRKAGVKNPVVVLDEIDKVARGGWAGDPEAALLEVLDPEQNAHFTDHYLGLPFDLSEVLFIATANDLSTLSLPLRDRLEIIELSGYTAGEKAAIADKHLWPQELDRHGLKADQVALDDGVLAKVIGEYTREAGVRRLKQQLAKLLRAVALDVVRKSDDEGAVLIDEARLRDVLGRPRFLRDQAELERPPGVAAGLAWTPVGGDVLYIETTRMPGKGKVEITGKLGEVMTESARAALAYVRTHAETLGIDPDFLESSDLHVHVPAGAVPKDGPSAGVTMFTALASLLTGRRVRPDLAMTGEATLRGRVLPVGGIKEKVLAAHRAGFERIVLPKKNAPDAEEIPESIREELEITFVSDMREVFEAALLPHAPEPTGPTLGGDDFGTHAPTH
ncbi:MAG: endopeptidase La [Myxococcota bacterium]